MKPGTVSRRTSTSAISRGPRQYTPDFANHVLDAWAAARCDDAGTDTVGIIFGVIRDYRTIGGLRALYALCYEGPILGVPLPNCV